MRETLTGTLIMSPVLSPDHNNILSILEKCSDKHEDCDFCHRKNSCRRVWDDRVSSYQYKIPAKEVSYCMQTFQTIMSQA
jgi:hypothetical protein